MVQYAPNVHVTVFVMQHVINVALTSELLHIFIFLIC